MNTQTHTEHVPVPDGPKLRFSVNDAGFPVEEIVTVNPETRQELHEHLDQFLDRAHIHPSGSTFFIRVPF